MTGPFDPVPMPREWWDDAPPDQWCARTYSPPALDRLTHLVLVDGRMVDAWTEPVEGTRWQQHADRFDAEHRPRLEPRPPEPPPSVRALEWLRALVGGAEHLDALDVAPLIETGRPAMETLPLPTRRRLEESIVAIDDVMGVLVEPELRVALLNALWLMWERASSVITAAASATPLVAGLVHTVGKANGVFTPQGAHRQRDAAEALGLKGSLGGRAHGVTRALRGFRGDTRHPSSLPDLLAVGEPSLLTSTTRRDVIRWRDQALSAQCEQAVLP